MLSGRSWLWRPAALHRARKMEVMHSDLPEEILMHLLAPRPLRMPNPRPHNLSPVHFHGSDVIAGPGFYDMKTGSCGFGCICLPRKEGTLTLKIRSCNISGSVALWSNSGYLTRVFLNAGQISEINAKLTAGERKLYLVPDRSEQIIELEDVTFTYK